jgi:serine/threonine protein kinase
LQILKAVSYIHSIGIIHRDIKSANILIQNGQVLKLADFGFAMFTSHTPTHCEYNVGSPVYMSPEAFTFNQYSVKSDVWSVGMIFYEMLIGQQPFYAYNWSDIIALITSGKIYESLQHVSSFSKQLFARMMEFDPRNRATTEELIKKVN